MSINRFAVGTYFSIFPSTLRPNGNDETCKVVTLLFRLISTPIHRKIPAEIGIERLIYGKKIRKCQMYYFPLAYLNRIRQHFLRFEKEHYIHCDVAQ